MAGKGIAAVALVAVVVIMIGSMMVPAINNWSLEEQTITNDDSGWLRMERIAYQRNYTVSVSIGADISIALDAASPQTGNDDTILYADSNMAVWVQDGTAYVTGNDHGTRVFSALDSDFTITHTINDPVTVDDGIVSFNFGSPEWAYLPVVTGDWAFYDNGTTVSYKDDTTPLAVGTFAGLGCYSTFVSQEIPMKIDVSGNVSGVSWIKGDSVLPLPDSGLPVEQSPNLTASPPTPTYTDGDWGYDLDVDNNAIIVSYSGSAGTITMPATVGGHNVVSVGKGAYNQPVFDSNLAAFDLIISSGIPEIGNNALRQSNMTSLTIPSSVTRIGNFAIQQCPILTTVNLSNGLVSIGSGAFQNNPSLESITIPDSVTTFEGTFTFYNTGLKEITLSENLTSLTDYCFNNCTALKSITIPSSVTTIGNSAFYGCSSLKKVVLNEGLTTIKPSAFANCTALESITIPSSVTTIGNYVFRNDAALKSVIVLSDVLASNMFTGCSVTELLNIGSGDYNTSMVGLESAEIRQDVESIGYLAQTEYSDYVPKDGGQYTFALVIPVIIIIVLLVAVAASIGRRD